MTETFHGMLTLFDAVVETRTQSPARFWRTGERPSVLGTPFGAEGGRMLRDAMQALCAAAPLATGREPVVPAPGFTAPGLVEAIDAPFDFAFDTASNAVAIPETGATKGLAVSDVGAFAFQDADETLSYSYGRLQDLFGVVRSPRRGAPAGRPTYARSTRAVPSGRPCT